MTNEQIIQKLKAFRDNGKVLLDPCLIDKDKIWKEMTEVFDMAISALEAQEWIPVKERLPEDVKIGEEYPTVIFSTKDAVYCGFYEYYFGGNWWATEDYIVNDVIAWKPLPEPYREDENETD